MYRSKEVNPPTLNLPQHQIELLHRTEPCPPNQLLVAPTAAALLALPLPPLPLRRIGSVAPSEKHSSDGFNDALLELFSGERCAHGAVAAEGDFERAEAQHARRAARAPVGRAQRASC